MKKLSFTYSIIAFLFFSCVTYAQNLTKEELLPIENILNTYAKSEISIGRISIDSTRIEQNKIYLYANENCSYIPFRQENISKLYAGIRQALPTQYNSYAIELRTVNKTVEELIPRIYRSNKHSGETFSNPCSVPLITRISNPFIPTKGLLNRHIAMWQSHGYYYEQGLARWEWQRARMFQTVEDLYTQSYVLPFLVPMLENAGATVLLPRERDCNPYEVIVDNDGKLAASSTYQENEGAKTHWEDGKEPGFAYARKEYISFENPFQEGTYRQIMTTNSKKEMSTAEWIPDIPKERAYAVYVSYKSLPNSTTDALYTIFHKDGETSFLVNQQMGGGTWIYLGTFQFDKGKKGKIVLSNLSKKKGNILTADAIKFGGGMGNIARRPESDGIIHNTKSSDGEVVPRTTEQPKLIYFNETSGYPRFAEGARYWLQWAGVPDSIYSPSKGKNDYTDDYRCRGLWVNYLAGGSKAVSDEKGLNIPINMSLAFHSDAGTYYGDTIVGTLGIYQTAGYNGMYANGASRFAGRDLTDLVMSNIVNDIRKLYEPKWKRRGMWDKSYFEARVPKVPAMLLELLSHENFADMRYGLDPRFRFTVSRAIYKGILQFLSNEQNSDYVVEPLPVDNFRITFDKNNKIVLSWSPVDDPLELTAKADKYKVYTRIGSGDFDNGIIVKKNSFTCKIPTDKVCSFKVAALNKGGESFSSEILSAGIASNTTSKPVLVINGFDRISAPDDFTADADSLAGFIDKDYGVPYLNDINFTGKMKEFRRKVRWSDDDSGGFGDSNADYEKMVIAGNNFDYPAVHGTAILRSGYSFTSTSEAAIIRDSLSTDNYSAIDLILGKEKQTKMGSGKNTPLMYKTFSKRLQALLTSYCHAGGRLFVSGAYVATDLWCNPLSKSEESDRKFATDVLKYKWRNTQAAVQGKVKSIISPLTELPQNYSYYNQLNEESYAVESPDAIEPADSCAYTAFRYSENNLSAGVVFDGTKKSPYRTVILGFPFESLQTENARAEIMKLVLYFLNKQQ